MTERFTARKTTRSARATRALGARLGALLAGGLPPGAAARVGAWVHGRAGDLVARRMGQRGLIAGDLGQGIGEVWAEWRR